MPLSNPSVRCPGSTLLSELSLSVACEQRDEWQYFAARPIDPACANRAFEFVYGRNRLKVSGNVISSFGHRAGNAESIADEAWSSVFCDYWSCKARRRFLGLCRFSTLVCQVARFIALDALRERGPVRRQRGNPRRRLPADFSVAG